MIRAPLVLSLVRLFLAAGAVVVALLVADGSRVLAGPSAQVAIEQGTPERELTGEQEPSRGERGTAFVAEAIHVASGPVVSPGVLLVAGGKVEAVIGGTDVPSGYRVVDVSSGVIVPGLVDAHTHHGLRDPPVIPDTFEMTENSDPFTPQVSILDSVDPESPVFAEVRALGVTTVVVLPGSSNLVSGQGAILKTRPGGLADKLASETPVLKMALGMNPKSAYGRRGMSPKTRMAQASMVREKFEEARSYRAARDSGEIDEVEVDPKLEVLARVVAGEIPVHIHAARADDVLTALRLMEEFRLRGSLGHVYEGYLVAEQIAARGVPVVIGPKIDGWFRGVSADEPVDVASALVDAGVELSIMTDGYVSDLLLQAAYAVRLGLGEDEALRAITINPARTIGLGDRIGSLEPGKDADFVIFDAPPFAPTARVRAVYIEGEQVFERQH